jgi:hypothetical protein
LWASPLAEIYDETDVPALRRLFDLRDERERAAEALRKDPSNLALLRQILAADAELRMQEDRLGLNPTLRLRLGLKVQQAPKVFDFDSLPKHDDDHRFDDRFEAL